MEARAFSYQDEVCVVAFGFAVICAKTCARGSHGRGRVLHWVYGYTCGVCDGAGSRGFSLSWTLAGSRAAQGVIVESLTVPVRFEMISEQKRDETKPTRPLNASEPNF